MKSIIVYHDKDTESYTAPRLVEGDRATITKSLYVAIVKGFKDDELGQFKHQELCYVGTFNEETGVIDACLPEVLLVCDKALAKRLELSAEEKRDEQSH